MSLETITGNLRDGYKQFQLGTMLHVDQLMNERRDNADLRNQWFYTADGMVYFLDGVNKTPTLAITREAYNPVLLHIDNAFEQLTKNKNYHPNIRDVQRALAAPDTVFIALPNLRLFQPNYSLFQCLALGTTPSKYSKLNYEERKLAERVYGQGEDFAQNMEMLKKAKIGETRIFVLNPDYVRKHAENGAVALASSLGTLDYGISDFSAIVRGVDIRNRVRGVRKEVIVKDRRNFSL